MSTIHESDRPIDPKEMERAVMTVAAARRVREAAAAQESAIRDATGDRLRPFAEAGLKNLTARLPDGSDLGQLVFEWRQPVIRFDTAAVTAFVAETARSELVETVDPSVLTDPEVIAWILERRPSAVVTSVREKYLDTLASRLDGQGRLVHPDTGECVQVAEVTPARYSGRFRWIPNTDQSDWLLTALTSGELDLDEVDTDLLTLLPDWRQQNDDASAEGKTQGLDPMPFS